MFLSSIGVGKDNDIISHSDTAFERSLVATSFFDYEHFQKSQRIQARLLMDNLQSLPW